MATDETWGARLVSAPFERVDPVASAAAGGPDAGAAALTALHREYHRTRDRALQDELVQRYQRLAFRLARKAAKREDEVDDLAQVALIGLVKALWRFDPERGTGFTTFAWSTIEGELKRHRRDNSWTIHVSRALQERYLRASAAIEELTHEIGRSPTIEQVAQRLKEPVEAIVEAISVRDAQSPASLDITPTEENPRQDPADPARHADEFEEREEIQHLMSRLSARERDIVSLRFFADMTQREIGERLGLSQMHVSRLLARALTRMREWAEA
jgi:RNA polymerase sigma-B factor